MAVNLIVHFKCEELSDSGVTLVKMLTGHVYTNVYSLPVSFLRRELSAYFLGEL